jgi:plasmid rolling circle replication initiator protein Rep
MSDAGRGQDTCISDTSVSDSQPGLADLSPRDKPWDKHRGNADKVAALYAGSEFQAYSDRVTFCSEFLQFGIVPQEDFQAMKLKLRAARFCRVRHCPVCQWRRSLMWKAKAYKVLPRIVEDYPTHRWLFVTLTQKNVPIDELKATLQHMNCSFQRMAQRKAWPAIGWLRSTEVTLGKNRTAHPHFHCLLMVKPGYFGKNYIKQAEWVELWRSCMRLDYNPILDVQAVKRGQQPMQLVPELLKYCTKESDLVADREWFLELTRQLHKMKAVATGGVLKSYLQELEQEPEDLIGKDDEAELTEDEISLFFGWRRVEKKYRLVDK